ncbi:GNAT family N-acetyltransferase [Pseudomonas qingdaonensis]|uniref:GNAT family N-acetyltransferase n=1 Tax=Pseudomonas qingdaonensis TaxID=2056231 RepID=A0ABX8DRQ1_9PSED|nr:GNAT family N-acetyltransferase [Pseudomonas qingdaonensis]QVL18966.1 GNAT family N-acetyltransferase [Pseudomonas qingdaonensis]
MPDTTFSDQQLIDTFLPQILENEAKGVLQDLLAQPILAMQFLFFSEEATQKAIKHVAGIFDECYRSGHLKVAMSHENACLYGYALLFVHPDPNVPRYCHKIFVFPEFRGHGIGSQILSALIEDPRDTSLLCGYDLIDFYENAGLEQKGAFTAPGKQQGFALTQGMYADLVVMGTRGANVAAGVFMLNDDDVKALLAYA